METYGSVPILQSLLCNLRLGPVKNYFRTVSFPEEFCHFLKSLKRTAQYLIGHMGLLHFYQSGKNGGIGKMFIGGNGCGVK